MILAYKLLYVLKDCFMNNIIPYFTVFQILFLL
nr:MAG TPA: hypothetical protein [Inoviridae sp.]